MDLNKASLVVWYELLKDEKYETISHRLLDLYNKENLSEDEVTEFTTLIKLERKFLKEGETQAQEQKNIVHEIGHYKEKLFKDSRLYTLFLKRVKQLMYEKDNKIDKEDISIIFTELMEIDVDVQGHERLNQEYDELLARAVSGDDFLLNINDSCENPDCIYCKEVTEEERDEANEILNDSGYIDMDKEEAMGLMMVTIMRLEDKLKDFMSIDCTNDLPDIDEDLE